jgi:hypothetical protein
LNPLFNLPSATTIRNHLARHVIDVEDKLFETLRENGKVALTLDCWTSPYGASFMAVMGSYIDKDWKLQFRLFGFEHLETIHSGEQLSLALEKLIRQHHLQGRITSITTDNARNNTSLTEKLIQSLDEARITSDLFSGYIQHIPCLAHIIQLSLRALLGQIRLNPTNNEILTQWTESNQIPEFQDNPQDIAYTLAKVCYIIFIVIIYTN